MESLTSYLNRIINRILGSDILENVIVDSVILTEVANDRVDKSGFIVEAKVLYDPVPGVKKYSYRIDKQQGEGGPGRQRHIHIFYNNEELFAMNVDSTAHDGHHQVRIPDELSSFLKKKGFPLPPNSIIELRSFKDNSMLLCENATYFSNNKIASSLRNAEKVAIIEANVDTYQVICNSKVDGNFRHVNKLVEIPPERIDEVRGKLVGILKSVGKYSVEKIEVFDDMLYSAPHRLFVAWS